MTDNHDDELVTDLTDSIEPQVNSDQGITSEWHGSVQDLAEDDVLDFLPAKSGKAFVGELLYGRYRIVSLIAKGGMGEVYKGKNEKTDQPVAIKVLSKGLAEKQESVYRFMREIGSVAALKHPNLIAVSDIGLTDNGCPYYVMEFVEGRSLADIIETEHRISVERTKAILIQLSSALSVAHQLGIIHRDIKPSNIIVRKTEDADEQIKLVDFGIAQRIATKEEIQRLTAKGMVFGSPLYMSPEQCEGKPTDARSDIYSTCCTIYECLSGRPPFRGETPVLTMSMHRSAAPEPLNLAGEEGRLLESIIMRGLAKNPQDRFENATEMRDALRIRTAPREEPVSPPAVTAKEESNPVILPLQPDSQEKTVATTEEAAAKLPAWFVQSIIAIVVTAISIVFFLQLLRNVFTPQ
ncbi:MAG TPA: serine/threonine protein kinase [Candidatus Melainabacteria bacterium]|nr:serine/threonine protein kinase [Candidatus Melainabacteria bacterium]